MQQSNGVGRGGGKDGGTKASKSINFVCACSILVLAPTPFFCILSDSPHGQGIVAAGLSIAKGRQSKGQFLFVLFVFTLA